MTTEQLNKAVTDAQRELASVTAERAGIDEKRTEIRAKINALQDEDSELWQAHGALADRYLKARIAVRSAESAVLRAQNNAIIAKRGGMSKQEFLASIRKAVRSKRLEIADDLVLTLERGVGYKGATAESLTHWREPVAEDWTRARRLSQAQVRRVHSLLNAVCPKTLDGCYLPPYEVQAS